MVNARRAATAALLVLGLAVTAACGDDARPAAASSGTGTPPPSSDGDAGGAVLSDASTTPDSGLYEGTILCEGTPQIGEGVPETELEGVGGVGDGGSITPGTYFLSEVGVYVGERDGGEGTGELGRTGAVERATIIVTTETIRRASARGVSEAPLPADVVEGFTYEVKDETLVLTPTCPNPSAPSVSVAFDASKSRLTLYEGSTRRIYTLAD